MCLFCDTDAYLEFALLTLSLREFATSLGHPTGRYNRTQTSITYVVSLLERKECTA